METSACAPRGSNVIYGSTSQVVSQSSASIFLRDSSPGLLDDVILDGSESGQEWTVTEVRDSGIA